MINLIQRRNKLIELRKERSLLQKDVIDLLKNHYGINISESYYGMIEQGTRTPNLRIALAIADLFDVDPRDIFFETGHNNLLPKISLGSSFDINYSFKRYEMKGPASSLFNRHFQQIVPLESIPNLPNFEGADTKLLV